MSIIEDSCTRHLIKAEGYQGRKFALPQRNVRPLYDKREKPAKPYTEGRFTIPFDYRGSFIVYQLSDYYLDQAITYALDIQPATIEIAGFAQTNAIAVSDRKIVEDPALARVRAEVVRRAMIMRGIAPERVKIVGRLPGPFVPAAFDGIDGLAERRVDVRIRPATSG